MTHHSNSLYLKCASFVTLAVSVQMERFFSPFHERNVIFIPFTISYSIAVGFRNERNAIDTRAFCCLITILCNSL